MPLTTARLPILAPVLAGFRDVFADFPATLRAMSLTFALLMLLVELPLMFLVPHAEKYLQQATMEAAQMVHGDVTGRLLVMGAAFSVYTIQMILLFRFMSGWYRQLLFNENKGSVIGVELGKPEWRLMYTSVKAGFALFPFIFLAFGLITAAHSGDPAKPLAFNPYPWLAAFGIAALYLRARLALAYPATMMNDTDAPVRQSWRLTRNQGWRVVLGNGLADAVTLGGIYLIFLLLSWIMTLTLPPEMAMGEVPLHPGLVFGLKMVAEFCILVMCAVLSAYHARAYAYLVRSSINSAAH